MTIRSDKNKKKNRQMVTVVDQLPLLPTKSNKMLIVVSCPYVHNV